MSLRRIIADLRDRPGAGRFASAFTSRFGSAVLSFVVLLVASHALPTTEYGLYVFLFSLGSALGLVFVLGQQILVVKHYRSGVGLDHHGNNALLRVNARWLLLGTGLLIAGAAVSFLIRDRLPSPYDELHVALVFAAIFALSEYLQNYFRIHGRINLSLTPREIVWRIASALALGGLAAAGLLVGGAAAFWAVTILLGAVTLFQLAHFVRDEGLDWLGTAGRTDAATRRQWRKESWYFIANNCLNSASAYLETIVIGAALGLDQAAFYFVALRIAMFLTLPVAAIDTVGIPMIAARFQASDVTGAQRLVGRLSAASFIISLMGALCLVVIGDHVLVLFNADFAQHHDVLVVLCLSAVSLAFFGPGSWLLMIGGGERYFLIGRSILFVFYLALLYGLARVYGLMGIAVAGLSMNVASNLIATVWVMRRWTIDNMATAVLRPFLLFDARRNNRAEAGHRPAATGRIALEGNGEASA